MSVRHRALHRAWPDLAGADPVTTRRQNYAAREELPGLHPHYQCTHSEVDEHLSARAIK